MNLKAIKMQMINRKKALIILSITIVSILCFQKCGYITNSNVSVLNNQIIYDSINYKGKDFRIDLYTTLEFKKNKILRNEYNDFLLIVSKDTFALIPEVNYLEKKSVNKLITIKYLSRVNFKSKIYNNDSIFNIIKVSSKIINSKGKEINRQGTYEIKSLITLGIPKVKGIKL